MEETRCPFCWDENVRHIDDVRLKDKKMTRMLMECEACEKFYWKDTKEIVTDLSDFCETLISEPKKCDEEIRNEKVSRKFNHDKRKMEEFDLLCGICSYRKFLLNQKKSLPKALNRS